MRHLLVTAFGRTRASLGRRAEGRPYQSVRDEPCRPPKRSGGAHVGREVELRPERERVKARAVVTAPAPVLVRAETLRTAPSARGNVNKH